MAKKGNVTVVEALVVLVVLGALGAFGFNWAMEGIVHSRKVESVPQLVGKSISGALDTLAPLNLSLLKDGSEFNSQVPIGSILRQLPPAGTKVREGKTIRVVVSQGGETVFAPSLTGLPLRNAEMLLRESQLTLGEVTDSYSLRLDKGLVMSQDPASESSVERNALVNVVVSAGPPPAEVTLMPDFSRKNLAEASKWASEKGVPIAVDKDANSLFPYGTILAQDPAPDAVVNDETKVKLTISARPSDAKDMAQMTDLQYQVPQGSAESLVRIVLTDEHGERELFNGLRAPGTKIDLAVPKAGHARAKIYLNGILVEERDL
ncbi:MAG: PASTA domain-containing protein [Elusimicrobia bacterium]|nr:PASTA domain-containing protein [Elusimicrobiota bacterium]